MSTISGFKYTMYLLFRFGNTIKTRDSGKWLLQKTQLQVETQGSATQMPPLKSVSHVQNSRKILKLAKFSPQNSKLLSDPILETLNFL